MINGTVRRSGALGGGEPEEVGVWIPAQLSCDLVKVPASLCGAHSWDGLCRSHPAQLTAPDPKGTQHDRQLTSREMTIDAVGRRRLARARRLMRTP